MSREQSASEEEATPPPNIPPPTPPPPVSTQPGGPPPPYSGTRGHRPLAPPTYQSLFSVSSEQMNLRTVIESRENIDNSAYILCCLLLFSSFPVVEIIIGVVYLDKCELQRNIPIFLIVLGSASLLHTVLNIFKRFFFWLKNRGERNRQIKSCFYELSSCFEAILMLFIFVWLIIGSFWVFGNFDDWKWDKDSHYYCHPLPYLFSFILLIIFYSLLAIVACFSCCVCCRVFFECYWAARGMILEEIGRDEELGLVQQSSS